MTGIDLGGSFEALIVINAMIRRMAIFSHETPEKADRMLSSAGQTGEKDTEHADVTLINGQLSPRMGPHERRIWGAVQRHPSQCQSRLTGRVKTEEGALIETYAVSAQVDATFWTVMFRRFARGAGMPIKSAFEYEEHELAAIADHALEVWRKGPDDGTRWPDYPWAWLKRVQEWENARRIADGQRRSVDPETPSNRGRAKRAGATNGHSSRGGRRGAGDRAERQGNQ